MRALITGINGFAGGHLAEHLLEIGGWEIWGLARSAELTLPHLRGEVQMVCADLCDAAQTLRAIIAARPQAIFHLAGQPFVPESFRDPGATLTTNTLGALHIFLALIEHRINARVLVVGTTEEYGQIRPEDLPLDEDTPLRPINPYGVSKAAQSLLALQYHLSHHLDVVRVRPFTHIGPRQSGRFASAAFAQQIVRIEANQQLPIVRVGNLSAQRDFTDVRDMVRAYHLAMVHGQPGAVYNLGSGRAVTVRDILDGLLAASTADVEVQLDPTLMRPVDIPILVCDTRRFFACSGWQPQIPLEQTLRDILDDWRQRVFLEQSRGNQ